MNTEKYSAPVSIHSVKTIGGKTSANRSPAYPAKILIAEDDPAIRALLQRHLAPVGYDIVMVENGQQALDAATETEFAVVLTDLLMPGMSGQELIDRLKELPQTPVIIVLTAEDTTNTIIQTMRKGVFDYLIKPVQREDLLLKTARALEVNRLVALERNVEAERRIRMERQLEWTLWKQNVMNRENDRLDRNLFQNLHTSFSQGAGFGVLLSLIQALSDMAEERPDGYLIEREVMEMVREGAAYAERSLAIFENIFQLVSEDIQTEARSLIVLHELLQATIDEHEEFIAIKKHEVLLSDCPLGFADHTIAMNTEYLKTAFTELLKNALKFSPAASQVLVLLRKDNDRVFISFMNQTAPTRRHASESSDAGPKEIDGIPAEYERLVFEPFFRIVKTVDERFATIDNGLGLTLVQKIILRHKGTISLFNVHDHIGANLRVNAEIELPLLLSPEENQ
ncbi:MAG: response regulator [bacterium]|nr:response regulator [bacterium]